MHNILGLVLAKEANVGIPNLVVAAYDSQVDTQDIFAARPREDRFSPATMERMGKRLGSVLTDSNGRFVLHRDELAFPGNEVRPDLLVVVFAPEDSQGVDQPFPLPPEQRILHVSRVPRVHAGSEEAYIIRLLQVQLDKYSIPTGASTTTNKSTDASSLRMFDAIESAWNFRDNLAAKVKPRLAERMRQSAERKAIVQRKLKNLSAIPHALRADPLLLKDPKQLAEVHRKVLKAGLDTLKKRKTNLRLTLTSAELDALGLKVHGGKVTGTVKGVALATAIKTKTGGVDLIRARDPITTSAAALLQKYTIPPAPPPANSRTASTKPALVSKAKGGTRAR